MSLSYRLVAIDLDGTVLDRDGAIIPGAEEAIERMLARGIRVTLATGRMYQPSNRFAEELNISTPLICYQGALVREPGYGQTLWHKPLPAPLARRLVNEIRRLGVHQYAYVGGDIYVEEIGDKDLPYARHNGVQLNQVDDLLAIVDKGATEMAARGEPEEIDRLIGRIRASCGTEVIVNKVHGSFCEIAHVESGKGNALRFLADRIGIPQNQTVAIGDSPNDISMLHWAGLGIVVGDAPVEVRAAADWVVDGLEPACFCQAVERLLESL